MLRTQLYLHHATPPPPSRETRRALVRTSTVWSVAGRIPSSRDRMMLDIIEAACIHISSSTKLRRASSRLESRACLQHRRKSRSNLLSMKKCQSMINSTWQSAPSTTSLSRRNQKQSMMNKMQTMTKWTSLSLNSDIWTIEMPSLATSTSLRPRDLEITTRLPEVELLKSPLQEWTCRKG